MKFSRWPELIARQGGYSYILNGSRPILSETQLKLQSVENYMGLHYAGRADFDEATGEQVLLLAQRTKLTAGMLPKLLRSHPVVFLQRLWRESLRPTGPATSPIMADHRGFGDCLHP